MTLLRQTYRYSHYSMWITSMPTFNLLSRVCDRVNTFTFNSMPRFYQTCLQNLSMLFVLIYQSLLRLGSTSPRGNCHPASQLSIASRFNHYANHTITMQAKLNAEYVIMPGISINTDYCFIFSILYISVLSIFLS